MSKSFLSRFSTTGVLLLTSLMADVSVAAQPSTLKTCSVAGTTAATLRIVNNHNRDVDIYWVNYQCQEQFYSTLAPGKYVSQQTFVTHPWRLREKASGELLKQVTPQAAGTTVVTMKDECSAGSVDPVQMEIYNNSGSAVNVYWKDYACQEKFYNTVNAGVRQTFYTYAGHPWRVRKASNGKILKDIQLTSTSLTKITVSERLTADKVDDSSSYQTHLVYVLPSDRADEQIDLNGSIATSVAAAQKWLSQQSGGQSLRFDTYRGALDISFVRLPLTDAQMIQQAITKYTSALFLREVIQDQLNAMGYNDPGTVYVAYYGGSSPSACGGASNPPDGAQGNVVALYLWGAPPGAMPCHDNVFAKNENSPGYWEFSMMHEVFHALGAVPNPASASIPDFCAPHHTLSGHVSDSPSDLMYAGSQPWTPSILDYGHDDYFNVADARCPDLARSVFLSPAAANAVPPLGWQ